jgi:hypothetical protein
MLDYEYFKFIGIKLPNTFKTTKFHFYFTSEKLTMNFTSRFFYEDGASEIAGGTDVITTQEATTTTTDNITTQIAEQKLPDEVLAKLAEYEELKAFKAANTKPDEKTPEQILKEKEQDKADFIKYAVTNDLCNIDDITKYESLKVQSDADLVFPEFLQDFKEDNPGIVDEKELAEAAKEEFNSRYKISSDNEAAKAKGLAKLAKAANEIRSPYEAKVKAAETNYTEDKTLRAKMPEFDKFVDNQITKNAPDKIPFTIKNGKEEITLEVELSKEDKEAIAKEFKTPKTFLKYSKSPEEAEKALEKKIQGWVKVNKFEDAITKALVKGEGIGVTKGSNIGAENPFGLQEPAKKEVSAGSIASNQAANEARKRVANNR